MHIAVEKMAHRLCCVCTVIIEDVGNNLESQYVGFNSRLQSKINTFGLFEMAYGRIKLISTLRFLSVILVFDIYA